MMLTLSPELDFHFQHCLGFLLDDLSRRVGTLGLDMDAEVEGAEHSGIRQFRLTADQEVVGDFFLRPRTKRGELAFLSLMQTELEYCCFPIL